LNPPHDVEDHRLLVLQEPVASEQHLSGGTIDSGDARVKLEALPALVLGAELPNAQDVSKIDGRPAFADRPRFEGVQRRTDRFARMARSGTERYAVEGRLLELETPCRVLGLL
jgi:hypothetical protein